MNVPTTQAELDDQVNQARQEIIARAEDLEHLCTAELARLQAYYDKRKRELSVSPPSVLDAPTMWQSREWWTAS
jgi:hypothetical protein